MRNAGFSTLCAGVAMTCWAILACAPAQAIYLSESAGKATLYGPFDVDDAKVFAAFLAKPRASPIKVLYLESPGGSIAAGVGIGRMVRKAGLTTAVNADSQICDSACTLVFAAGVRRHYVHGDSIYEGLSSRSGLGYHPAYLRGDRVHFSIKSNEYVALMNAYYAEMGAPRAAELLAKAGINSIFRPSGKTALDLHIATSLIAP